MVGFKMCSGTLAVTFGLVPLFIMLYCLFVCPFPILQNFPPFCADRQGGVGGTVAHGLRGTLGRKGVMQSMSVLHGSPCFAFSDASVCMLKSTFSTEVKSV